MKLTYKKSGVDIEKAESLLKDVRRLADTTLRSEVLKGIGGFGGFFNLDIKKYKEPILVSSSDGVGTKLKVAFLAGKHDTVGIDLVAMNVNDILCCGAEPLFFLDYIGCSKLEPQVYKAIIKGIARGCKDSGCTLIGGETAEMPGMYKNGEYDLAGFCVGIVEKSKVIDSNTINTGDVVIGIASSGLHSNGFSLVRKVFSQNELKRLSKELLVPTRIYVKPILSLLSTSHYPLVTIKGIAHVTGGAFYEKIKRIIPQGAAFEIKKNSWPVPGIFRLIQNKGSIEDKEMFRTFNMGIGMVLAVAEKDAREVIGKLSGLSLKSWVIGKVIKGKREVVLV